MTKFKTAVNIARIAGIILCVSVFSCDRAGDIPEIGMSVKLKALNPSNQLLLRSAGQLDRAYLYSSGNCDFLLCVNDQGRVIYIQTTDPDFNTPEGINVSSVQGEVVELLKAQTPTIERGWAKYYTLESGWKVAYRDSASGNSSALYLFKR